MEEPERIPVFHSRLLRTQRRRFTRPDGTHAGWLITDAPTPFYQARPPTPLQSQRVPGTHCPVPGCTHHHAKLDGGFDDPPQLTIPQPR